MSSRNARHFSVQAEGVEGIQHQPFPNFVPTLPFFPKIWWAAFTSFSTRRFWGARKKYSCKAKCFLVRGMLDTGEASKGSNFDKCQKQLQSAEEPFWPVSINQTNLDFPVNQLCAGKRQITVFACESVVSVYIYNICIYIYTRFFLQWR